MRRKAKEHKPSWLRIFAPPGNLAKLEACVCEGCGRWVIVQQLGVWDTYDAGIIQGDDIMIAIILKKRLTRIRWNVDYAQPTLIDVCGDKGISPDGQYLAEHDCRLGRVSDAPFHPPRKPRLTGKPFTTSISDDEVKVFEKIWRAPLCKLNRLTRTI